MDRQKASQLSRGRVLFMIFGPTLMIIGGIVALVAALR